MATKAYFLQRINGVLRKYSSTVNLICYIRLNGFKDTPCQLSYLTFNMTMGIVDMHLLCRLRARKSRRNQTVFEEGTETRHHPNQRPGKAKCVYVVVSPLFQARIPEPELGPRLVYVPDSPQGCARRSKKGRGR